MSKRGQMISVSVCIRVCTCEKWMKVSGENIRKAAGEVDTSLKAADEGLKTEGERENGILGAEPFSLRDC